MIVLDHGARSGSVEIVIDTTSVHTGSAELDRHVQGEYGLDSANHPTITFKSTRLDFSGEAPVSVDGNLTIKGVTWPVTFQLSAFHCILQACGASAHTTIRRSDFNAGSLIPYVEDELALTIVIEAVRRPEAPVGDRPDQTHARTLLHWQNAVPGHAPAQFE
jgi:polyisoprenoid-binding protein YceI